MNRKPGIPDEVIIDDEDRVYFSAWHWYLTENGTMIYDRRGESYRDTTGKERFKVVYLHREIVARILGRSLTSKDLVDHINGNSLDCSRSNLRVVDRQINARNRLGATTQSKSGIRGVRQNKYGKRVAFINIGNHPVYLGAYNTKEAAESIAVEARERWMPGYVRR